MPGDTPGSGTHHRPSGWRLVGEALLGRRYTRSSERTTTGDVLEQSGDGFQEPLGQRRRIDGMNEV